MTATKRISVGFDTTIDPGTSRLSEFLLEMELTHGWELDICRLVLSGADDGVTYASVTWAYVDAYPVIDRPHVRSTFLPDPALPRGLVGAAVCALTVIDDQHLDDIWLANERSLTDFPSVQKPSPRWLSECFDPLTFDAGQQLVALGEAWLLRASELFVGRDGFVPAAKMTKLFVAKVLRATDPLERDIRVPRRRS